MFSTRYFLWGKRLMQGYILQQYLLYWQYML